MAWEVLWEEAWSPAPPCNYLYTTTLGKLCQNRSPLCRVLCRERLVLPYIYLLQGRKGILMYGQYTESKTIPEVTLLSPTSSLPQLPSDMFHCLISSAEKEGNNHAPDQNPGVATEPPGGEKLPSNLNPRAPELHSQQNNVWLPAVSDTSFLLF